MKTYTKKLEEVIKKFTGKKILIVGDLMLDEYLLGKTTRLSPEAPVPIVEVEKISYVPGGAANVANNVNSLGYEAILCGVVGKDENGQRLINLLQKQDIKTTGIFEDINRPTTLKSRIVLRGKHVIRIDKESRKPIPSGVEKKLLAFIKKSVDLVSIILISDYAKGVITPTLSQAIINLVKNTDKRVLVDPKGKNFKKYQGCFMVTPNLCELETILKIKVKNLEELPKVAKTLLTRMNSEAILTTLGANGMALMEKSGKYTTIPATTVKVVDISGAGDTAIATFALALTAGANFYEAMLLSTYASSVTIGKMGTATASRNELIKAIKEVTLKKIGKK